MKKLIFCLTLITASFGFISYRNDNSSRNIKNKIDNILKWEEKFGFSGSVLVVKDGEIILSKGYGYADEKAKKMMKKLVTSQPSSKT